MSEQRRLREVFRRHAHKIIELRELTEVLAHEVNGGKDIALMPSINLLQLPRLLLKALQSRRAAAMLLRRADLQEKMNIAIGDGSSGHYCDKENVISIVDLGGTERIIAKSAIAPEDVRPQYIKLSHQLFLMETPSLRAMAFDRLALTAIALLPEIPKSKFIPALDAAFAKCTDHSPRLASGELQPVPLQKVYGPAVWDN